METRLKVWLDNGKIAVEFTDGLGRKNGPLFFPPNAETIEFWASINYGVLYIQEESKMHVYDAITSEKLPAREAQ
jgi:hypothetical protein